MAIPYKKFMRLMDLEAEYIRYAEQDPRSDAAKRALEEVEAFKDVVVWPWKASDAQLEEWNAWLTGR